MRLIDATSDYVHAVHGVLPDDRQDYKFENLVCVTCEVDEDNKNSFDGVDEEPPPQILHTILAPAMTRSKSKPKSIGVDAADDEPEHFIVHSVINGQKVNLLVDTGATTEYIDEKFARRIGVDVDKCRPRSVRLGNNTISIIDKKVDTTLRCGEDFSTKVTFYVMKALPVGIDALVGMRYLNDHNIWLNPKTKRMLILGQNQSQLHVAAIAPLNQPRAAPGGEEPSVQHRDDRPPGSARPKEHTPSAHPTAPPPPQLGLHTMQSSDADAEIMDNDILNVSGKTFKHLLNLMQRNALDFTALERMDANLDSISKNKKDKKTRHKQRLSKHTDLSGQTFRGQKTAFPKGRSAGEQADEDLLEADLDEHLRTIHKPGSDSQSQVHEQDEVCLVNLRFLPDGSFDFAPETEQESLNAIELQKQLAKETVNFYETRVIMRGPDMPTRLATGNAGGIYDLMHVSHDSYKEPSNSLNKGDDDSNVSQTSTADPAREAATQSILMNLQRYAEAQGHKFSPEDIDKTDPEFQEWVTALLQRTDEFPCTGAIPSWAPLPTDPLLKINKKRDAAGNDIKMPPPRRFKTPVHMLQALKNFITEMVSKNYIRKSTSPYSSPVLVIPKPRNADGSSRGFRLVTDFRAINECVEPIQHYIPDIETMYAKLRDAKYISTFDLKNGYWQAGLSEDSKPLTAFSCEYGTWEYNVVPQGLVCSAAHFQSWVETKLRRHGILFEHVTVDQKANLKNPKNGESPVSVGKLDGEQGFVAIYIDDLIVFSKSSEDHKRHLVKLLDICSKERLYLNPDKSHIFCKYTRYLGAICGNKHLYMDPEKVKAISTMPTPSTQTEIRAFLGACSFYRRWVGSYAKIAAPLNDLLKKEIKDVPEAWAKDPARYNGAVTKLKAAITEYPALRQPDLSKPFTVYSDACDYAIGAVLAQEHDNKMCAVAFVSRSLHGPEKNYSVQEKEALGVVHAVKKFRHYLLCSNFQIRLMTDHHSLQFLKNGKELAGRMARWAMILSEYNYSIQYIKGTLNEMGDSLSRLVAMPPKEWENLPSDERDGDDHHPFLNIWPDLNLFVLMDTFTADISSHVQIDTGDETVFRQQEIDTEERLNCITSEEEPHERTLFSRFTVTVDSDVLKIEAIDYANCPDFADLYKHIQAEKNQKNGSNLEKQKKSRKSDSKKSTTQQKQTKKDKEKTSLMRQLQSKYDIARFFIDENNELLYKVDHTGRETLCVPQITRDHEETLRYKLFRELHATPLQEHRGIAATQSALQIRFFWPSLKNDVKRFVSACTACQTNKINRKKPAGGIQILQQPTGPGQSYSMDFLTDLPPSGPEKFDALWVIVDRFSMRKYGIRTWKYRTAELCAEQFFEYIVCDQCNGMPREIISDRDTMFTSKFWCHLMKRCGTAIRLSSARSQQTNGLAERTIATVEECLRNSITYKQDWAANIAPLFFALNTVPLDILAGKSSALVEQGYQPRLPLDLSSELYGNSLHEQAPVPVLKRIKFMGEMHKSCLEQIHEAKRRMVSYADERRRVQDNIKIGSYVWLSLDGIDMNLFKLRPSAKLNPLWFGKFKVIDQPSAVSYKLQLPEDCNIHDTFHVSRLKPATDEIFSNRPDAVLPTPAESSIEDVYEIEALLDHDFKYNVLYYLVHWKDHSHIYANDWIPRSELHRSARDILHKYEKKHGIDFSKPETYKGGTTAGKRKRVSGN